MAPVSGSNSHMQHSIREDTSSGFDLWILLTLGWAAYIFFMSTESFGGDHSRSVLDRILHVYNITVSTDALSLLNTLFRKSAHLIEYALFAFFLHRSMSGRGRVRTQRQLATWCIGIAAAYSLTDEVHQQFVPGRNGSLVDWCIDVTGAIVAMLALYGWSTVIKTKTRVQQFSF